MDGDTTSYYGLGFKNKMALPSCKSFSVAFINLYTRDADDSMYFRLGVQELTSAQTLEISFRDSDTLRMFRSLMQWVGGGIFFCFAFCCCFCTWFYNKSHKGCLKNCILWVKVLSGFANPRTSQKDFTSI